MNKREELLNQNKKLIQIPMPNLEAMTNEELEKRADILEMAFEMAFDVEIED